MTERPSIGDTIRYDDPGTLIKPQLIGRLVRISMGVLCLWVTWQLAFQSAPVDLINPSWWFLMGITLLLVTYVVNLGFGLSIGGRPRNASIAFIVVAAVFSNFQTGQILGEPLWWVGNFWMVYVFGHLGISFVLSSIIATPGCEMRAIPHLIGIASGKDAAEHYCPAFIDKIDKWEDAKNKGIELENDEDPNLTARDLLRNPGRMLLFYGIPIAIIQLAGNLGGFTVATLLPALALLAMALISFIEVLRCRRVHCYFLGPWFLVAGVLLLLYSFRIVDFGPSTWSIVVNTALVGGLCVSMHMEMIWGKYFQRKSDA